MTKKLMMMVAAVAVAFGAWADTETVGGYTWTYRINGDTAEIYKGSSSPAISALPTGAVTIPSTLGGRTVTSIGSYAFYNCSGLTGVTIPDSVTNIGNRAFYNCSGLTGVTIPDSVTSIGGYAFFGCSGLTSVTIPNSVTSIGQSAFQNCSSRTSVHISDLAKWCGISFGASYANPLYVVSGFACYLYLNGEKVTDLTIPDGVTSVGDYAFSGYSGLTSVTIPDSVTRIGSSAFFDCSRLTSVTIPGSVTNIGDQAFYNCRGLTSVTIGNGVANIGDQAFFDCSRLTSVSIPGSVTSIGHEAFSGCSDSLFDTTTIPGVKLFDGWAVGYFGDLSGDLNLTGIRGIGERAFYNCSGLTSVTIPGSVTSIGHEAFSGCSGLTSVTIPASVTSIGVMAFDGCSGLTSVTIPNSVTRIGSAAFYGCSGLTSVTIPNSVTSIGSAAFGGCSGLTSVTIPNSVTSIEDWAFYGCSGLTSVTIPNSVTSIGREAFSGCSDSLFDTTTIPGVKLFDGWAVGYFGDLSGDLNLTGVRGIGDSAFKSCSRLTSVTIGNGVTSIGVMAFDNCYGLTSVTIPDSVRYIAAEAFSRCRALSSVTLPPSVEYIGNWAFAYGDELAEANVPRHLEEYVDDGEVFYGGSDDLQIDYYDYIVRFHKNDASNDAAAEQLMDAGTATRLTSLNSLGWAKRGLDFIGWGKYPNSTVVWKSNWANVTDLADSGETVDLYAMWAVKPGGYAIQFIRNDGAGTWRTVGFNYGEKTRIPSLANGLGWARRGYEFKGWALTTADANAGTIWKGDWAYVATPVKAGEVLTVYAVWALKPGYYQIRFNKNDGGGKWRTLGFACDKSTKLSTIAGLGWERPDCTFRGWASNKANADAGKVWKPDGAWVTNATAEGRTLSIYAIWE